MLRIYQAAASLFYIFLFIALYPWYQYVLDIDAISYMHVAERVAHNGFLSSVNGYWSPLISWIIVPFIKAGADPMYTLKIVNGALGLLSMQVCFSILNKLNIDLFFNKIIPFILAVLFISYAYYELCADLLQVFLVLIYLRILFTKNFIESNRMIVASAAVAALAYYAKAYNLPFFLLHFSIVCFLGVRKSSETGFYKAFLKKMSIALAVVFILTAPYIYLLTKQYGSFRISNAGILNTSWFLSPGLTSDRNLVAVPPYPDASSYWDEPTYTQKKIVGPFTAPVYFFREVKIVISNVIKLTGLLNTMSIFIFSILIVYLIYLYRKKKDAATNDQILLVTTLTYPFGYLMIFIEWRYIWLLPIVFILMLARLLTYWKEKASPEHRKLIHSAAFIALCSFLYQPVNELQDLKGSNKDVFEIAAVFKKNHIQGRFFVNYYSFEPYYKTVEICHLTHSQLYGPIMLDYTMEEWFKYVKQYQIKYYLFYYQFPNQKEAFLQSDYVKAGIRTFDHLYPGIVLVQLSE